MDQDIHFQHKTAFVSGSTPETFMKVPYECTIRDVTAVLQGDPGDGDTLTIEGGGSVASGAAGATTTLGVVAFGSGVAAGTVGTWTEDATNGGMTLLAGSMLSFTLSDGTAADVDIDIELDPYAR